MMPLIYIIILLTILVVVQYVENRILEKKLNNMKKKLPPCFAFKNTGKHPRKVEAEDSYEFELSYPHETADESTAIKSLPSLDEAGIAAVKILHRVSPELSEKEQSFFVAGFQECIKWLKLNSEPEKKVEPEIVTEPDFPYKGDIKDFPKEVGIWMMDCQEAQGNKRDISVFEKCRWQVRMNGGFDWNNAFDGYKFCENVILHKLFGAFYE